MTTIKVPQLAWYEPKELELHFPDSWQVDVHNIAGYNRPALTDEQIKESIQKPIGMSPIREKARGKKEAVIIFDDIHRVTRVAKIVPFLLEELAAAGIPDSNIRFIAALGSHGAMNRIDFVKKLGEQVVSRFLVYNHNPFVNCTYVGTTSFGNKICVNAEVMNCDFKIAIGSISPHPRAVYGGGGKIILPGISSVDTIVFNHSLPTDKDYWSMPRNVEKEESVKLVGLDVLVECLYNMWGDTVSIYTGHEPETHAAAVKEVGTHYLAPIAAGASITMAPKGGDLVIIGNTPDGQVSHYLMGRWGKNVFAKLNKQGPMAPHIKHLFWYCEYPDLTVLKLGESRDRVRLFSKWNDLIKALHELHGDKAKVAVYPSADVQYFG
ncbi:MAG: lactate racemase domain-containing protein [Chloroflexi bacterium]|nr:lactate racemase domain-containing protein [Chloroflexota bacterium]